jgi:hypothetical protein
MIVQAESNGQALVNFLTATKVSDPFIVRASVFLILASPFFFLLLS